eukprot:TRINITY_DN2468_c0_g1_i1.p1 TRINITY_DN2468_c0_g1~~TRINITY_DN2468_c0_g1_i1.p1  ORF type:complete len:299 (+),score=62.10 TRINITY_DN2468_c0_g1_i1:383-1279(+)
MDSKVASLSRVVQDWRADAIFFDISAAACLVGHDAKIPAIGMSNFDWAWIYEHIAASLRTEDPTSAARFDYYVAKHTHAYGLSSLFLALPNSSPATAFPHRADIPWVARISRKPAAETRKCLGIADGVKLLLISFGGHAFPMDLERWNIPDDWRVLLVGSVADQLPDGARPAGLITHNDAALEACGLGYVDVVAAVDCVVGKLGYGLVSECVAHARPILYVTRNAFAEEVLLRDAMRQAGYPVHEVALNDVLSATAKLFAAAGEHIPQPYSGQPEPDCDGAEAAADLILKRLDVHSEL